MEGHRYVMGIVNVTPDSFSDGGRYYGVEAAVSHGLELVRLGADLLDIGGESTRPGHVAVSASEECDRVVAVMEELRRQTDVPLSIDTRKSVVAEACLRAGADIINDVTGFREEREAKCELAGRYGAGCILMHWQAQPGGLSGMGYVDWVCEHLSASVSSAMAGSGLDGSHFMVDPGIGFDKSDAENFWLLSSLDRIRSFGWPLLLGISRKSFIGRTLGIEDPSERLFGTAGATAIGSWLGADVHRVHDVGAMMDVLRIVEAVRSHRCDGIKGSGKG